MSYKTNYVLCTWSGNRRMQDPRRDADPTFYIRNHMHSLSNLRHNLDQITIMVPFNAKEPPEFRNFLKNMPKTINSTNVMFIDRENYGFSYGSLAETYELYRTHFDYYFFMEDDYVFTQHNFDKIHLDVMENDPACGYLCGLAWEKWGMPMHAGISNGLLRTEALEKVFKTHGSIPHAKSCIYTENEMFGQVGQSQAIIKEGYTLRDWAGKFKVGYREFRNVKEFHDNCKEFIMMPI